MNDSIKILKFGGSSVRNADAIRQAIGVIQSSGPSARAVVVSAMGGVTDALLEATRLAEQRDEGARALIDAMRSRHLDALRTLTSADSNASLEADIESAFHDLGDLVHGIHLLREASPRTRDAVVGYGERLSSLIVAAALRDAGTQAMAIDARRLIVTDDSFGAARVDLESTEARIRAHFDDCDRPTIQVVPGFVAATAAGQSTTLGRGGSDYTAALLGAALNAACVELWTDVDAVMSADPRVVPDARPIGQLSYLELLELCHFGAKVVHPPAIHPSRAKGIPLRIRNTFNPDAPYTRVVADNARSEAQRTPTRAVPVRGITAIGEVALIRLEGDGMVGVPGIAGRLFSALSAHDVNVILITQASSEHSICFAIAPQDVAGATRAIDDAFALERRLGMVDPPVVEDALSAVAVVGAGMRDRPGIAAQVFGALGDAGISVRAIAQGSSELNISMIVDAGSRDRAVRALHRAFLGKAFLGEAFLGENVDRSATTRVALAGVGGVGGALLAMLADRAHDLDASPRLGLVAVGGSRGWLVDPEGIAPDQAVERLRGSKTLQTLDAMLAQGGIDVFVDATASAAVPKAYDRVMDGNTNAAVVTANKLRLAGHADEAAILERRHGRLFFETTVGAGLPVIGTLEDLIASGDRVHRIEATLSGTLGFLTSALAEGRALSSAVRDAFDRGYTEPDPREDLAGNDAARKLVILSRVAAGHWRQSTSSDSSPSAGPRFASVADVEVTPMLPNDFDELDLETFWTRLPGLDDAFRARVEAAKADGRTLVCLGTLDVTGARLGLEPVPASHPAAMARGTENVIVITTDRYRDSPLVVRGPGAGTDVTAAGLLADVLRATSLRGSDT